MTRTRDLPDAAPTALGPSIADVYGGPLDGFVARRDALARDLRAAGRRDEAAEVKSLRKPKALAWALDAGVLADPEAFAELDAAVGQVGEAQDGGGDIRAAIARLRDAEAAMVAAADDAARGHDHPVDRTALASALRAVVGTAPAMEALRAGRLVDTTPGTDDDGGAAGGEEMWAVSAPARTSRSSRTARTSPGGSSAKGRAKGDRATADEDAGPVDDAATPRVHPKELRAARRTVATAERAATKTEAAAAKAEAAADDADTAAAEAEDDAAAARRRADRLAEAARRARDDADARAAERDAAEAELSRARAALDELAPPDA